MFNYRPSKGNCWGHAIHRHSSLKVLQKMDAFFGTYFEPVAAEKLTLILNPFGDSEKLVPRIRENAVRVFGEPGMPGSVNWILGPGDYRRAVDCILDCHLNPKKPGDPVWLSFTCSLTWKNSALPTVEWPEELMDPAAEKFRRWFLMVNLRAGGRFMFPMGLSIPISIHEQTSYDFLARFAAAAPFKMSTNNFQVLVPVGNKGKTALRKPDSEIAGRLKKALGSEV